MKDCELLELAAMSEATTRDMDYDEYLHATWVKRAMELSHEVALAYSDLESDDGNDHMREWHNARNMLREHLMNQPASMALTDPELRAGVELQRKEIDRLKRCLRDEGDRINELRCAIEAMRISGGAAEFQAAFDKAKELIES